MKSKFFLISITIIITTIINKILCEKDLYKVFEVSRSASQNDIKKKTGKELPQYIYDSLSKFAPYSLGVLFCLSFLRSVNI